MRRNWIICLLFCGLIMLSITGCGGAGASSAAAGATSASPTATPDYSLNSEWVGTWGCSTYYRSSDAVGLSSKTLRQIVHVSIGGNQIRLKLTNRLGASALTLNSVHIAVSSTGSSSAIDTTTDKAITFNNGSESVTIAAGSTATSDTINYNLTALANMAITINFSSTVPAIITSHSGARIDSYYVSDSSGGQVAAASFSSPITTKQWFAIEELDVYTTSSYKAVVAFGDSITDGKGSESQINARWTDYLAQRLNSSSYKVGVLNQGIGATSLIGSDSSGYPGGVGRFSRDVLGRSGVRYLIILYGVNDIGDATTDISSSIITNYKNLISQAHANNILVYGGTITPFGGNSYYSTLHETIRQTVNTWISGSAASSDEVRLDGYIDFDAAVRDPDDTTKLLSAYQSTYSGAYMDGLHLGPAGYQAMAEAIDLSLFAN